MAVAKQGAFHGIGFAHATLWRRACAFFAGTRASSTAASQRLVLTPLLCLGSV